ncbi:hypothetical protein ACROYT_G006341 [Oculina patagonica]
MNETACSPAYFGQYNRTHDFPNEVYYVVSVANILILGTAILGNSVILAALKQCQTLHPPSKALLYSLVLSDLGVGAVVVPLKLALNLAVILKAPSLYCLLWRPFRIIAAVMGTVSFFTSTAIALDRYLAFRLRLRYRQAVTLRRVLLLLIAEWILAIIWACTEIVNETLNRVLGTVAILSCVAITLVCYQRIYKGLVVLPLFTAYYLMIVLEMPRYYCAVAITYGRTTDFIVSVSLQTIATIAIDRYLAFHLRLRYRELVKVRRVVSILAFEWILAAVRSGTWFSNQQINVVSGAIGLLSCCLITPLCYLSIHRGLRYRIAQIHQQNNSSELAVDFNIIQYKKTVNNMLWINGLLVVCYLPQFSSLLAVLAMGLNDSTRFALHFSAVAMFFNSSLNPIIYCWKIKELRGKVIALLRALYNFLSSHVQ